MFLAEPAGNLVSRIMVTDDGTMLRGAEGLRARRVHRLDRRAVSPGESVFAPDGTLYVVDMYHGIIQHKGYITEYLRDQILARRLDAAAGPRPHLPGRPHDDEARPETGAVHDEVGPQLVDLLSHPNGWWRDTAQQLIVERGDPAVVPALKEKAERAPDWRTRVHAMWTLDGIDAIEPATLPQRWTIRRGMSGCRRCGSPSAG